MIGEALVEEAVRLVRRWLDEAVAVPVPPAAGRLADVLKDPHGLAFTVGFVDGVIRPEDPRVAAAALARLARDVPAFLPVHLRSGVRLAALSARVAPGLVIPVVRRALRRLVGHLLVDASPRRLGRSIARLGADGTRLNLNLLGEAVLGGREARRRLDGVRALIARTDVDYVSVKVSATVAPHAPWAFEEAVQDVVARLAPVFEQAARTSPPTFVNLDMEEYRDLELTLAVFTALLDRPMLRHLEAGIVLQAYLPDSFGALTRLQAWAAARVSSGGAPVKVRIVKGANLPMEQVESSLHGWPLATWTTKQDTDTHYKRLLAYALQPDRIRNVRIGVAGHNLFDVALAWLLAGERGVRAGVEFEMLLGMAPAQAEVVRRSVGALRLYVPVVHPGEFDVAIAYLVRRLEEGASAENYMSAAFDLQDDAVFGREEDRFRASVAGLSAAAVPTRRDQDRRSEKSFLVDTFVNEPDTDPSLPANQAWAREVLSRASSSRAGTDLVAARTVSDPASLDRVLHRAVENASPWGARSGRERAQILRAVARELRARRGLLVEVMAAEAGKTVSESDPEVSEAVDFAQYYAELAVRLDRTDGAVAEPVRLTVVAPPWNFPVAIPAGSVLAALAAGSAVVLKPAPQAARCGSVLAEALWAAGVPRDVLQLVHVSESDLGSALIQDPRVDQVILTGAYDTAQLFTSLRPDLRLFAETSGKNAIVVTPSADLDLAAKDVAQSAFGHAGQKCSAASTVILVGSVARSRRFGHQLLDAVSSLRVGPAWDPRTQLGPLIEPARGKLLLGLTSLEAGESWSLEPHPVDPSGRQWTPGVRTGVRRGSTSHRVEYFGPVLGVMRAATLAEAVDLQNDVPYGLTAGLHSLADDEIAFWLDRVEAGNLYVNRGITGAVVRRQPFGGWKRSAVGPGFKAGGPNQLAGLVRWRTARSGVPARELPPSLVVLRDLAEEFGCDGAALERAFVSDLTAWDDEFGRVRDVTGLTAERNLFRYRPARTLVRLAAGAEWWALLRSVGAGLVAGADVTVSADELPPGWRKTLQGLGIQVFRPDPWWAGVPGWDRVRRIGAEPLPGAVAARRPDLVIFDQDVTEAGRVELLFFLREQAISITAHRFGTPVDVAGWLS